MRKVILLLLLLATTGVMGDGPHESTPGGPAPGSPGAPAGAPAGGPGRAAAPIARIEFNNCPVTILINQSHYDVDASGHALTSYSLMIRSFETEEAAITGILAFNAISTYNVVNDPCSKLVEEHQCVQKCKENTTYGVYQCACWDGYMDGTTNTTSVGTGLAGFVCTDMDECLTPDVCGVGQDTCTNTDGSYVCTCTRGYAPTATLQACENSTDISSGPVMVMVRQEMTDVDAYGVSTTSYSYQVRGFDDETAAIAGIASLSVVPSYTIVTDPCSHSTGHSNCVQGCKQNSTSGVYQCVCYIGYTDTSLTALAPSALIQHGTSCTDIDECTTSSICGPAQAGCSNNPGSYVCSCINGYSPTHDQRACELTSHHFSSGPVLVMVNESRPDVDASGNPFTTYFTLLRAFDDEPSAAAGIQVLSHVPTYTIVQYPCLQPGSETRCAQSCQQNTVTGIYQCLCDSGYSDTTSDVISASPLTQKGFACADIDECLLSNPICGMGQASCVNTAGSHVCTCLNGYTLSTDATTCSNTDECSDTTLNDCHVNSTCNDTPGSYTCTCHHGFTGPATSSGGCADIDECAVSGTCDYDATCINKIGSYICTCNAGFHGDGHACTDDDECADDTTNTCDAKATCTNTAGSYSCVCNSGYTGNGSYCEDLDECSAGNTCSNDAYCENTVGSYLCHCKSGYYGDGHTCTVSPACSGGLFITASQGEIVSPGYPSNYPLNLHCEWTITAPPNSVIEINITAMNIETHSACGYDYLEMRQGSQTGKLCGSEIPAGVTTYGNEVHFTFHSDDAVQATGFRLEYKFKGQLEYCFRGLFNVVRPSNHGNPNFLPNSARTPAKTITGENFYVDTLISTGQPSTSSSSSISSASSISMSSMSSAPPSGDSADASAAPAESSSSLGPMLMSSAPPSDTDASAAPPGESTDASSAPSIAFGRRRRDTSSVLNTQPLPQSQRELEEAAAGVNSSAQNTSSTHQPNLMSVPTYPGKHPSPTMVNTTLEASYAADFRTMMEQYQLQTPLGFATMNTSVEWLDTNSGDIIAVVCFTEMTATAHELVNIMQNDVTNVVTSVDDYDECRENYGNCSEIATCTNSNGTYTCACPGSFYDASPFGLVANQCVQGVSYQCSGSSATASLYIPYFQQYNIDVTNIYINDNCSGVTNGLYHEFDCGGVVGANSSYLIAAFTMADANPSGSTTTLNSTFYCRQMSSQTIVTNFTSLKSVVETGFPSFSESASSSLSTSVFSGGYENDASDGVPTGDQACVQISDQNLGPNVQIKVENCWTGAPGHTDQFLLLSDYCPVDNLGLSVTTDNGGVCFTMHRPSYSNILQVTMVVKLCAANDCPSDNCNRKKRSIEENVSRVKRSSPESQTVTTLISVASDDGCTRDCGVGACTIDFARREQCICPQESYKDMTGSCLLNNFWSSSGLAEDVSNDRRDENGKSTNSNTNNLTMYLLIALGCVLFFIIAICVVILICRRSNRENKKDQDLSYENKLAASAN